MYAFLLISFSLDEILAWYLILFRLHLFPKGVFIFYFTIRRLFWVAIVINFLLWVSITLEILLIQQ